MCGYLNDKNNNIKLVCLIIESLSCIIDLKKLDT